MKTAYNVSPSEYFEYYCKDEEARKHFDAMKETVFELEEDLHKADLCEERLREELHKHERFITELVGLNLSQRGQGQVMKILEESGIEY